MRARHAAVTSPTCPAPMTATCMLRVPPVVGGGVVDRPASGRRCWTAPWRPRRPGCRSRRPCRWRRCRPGRRTRRRGRGRRCSRRCGCPGPAGRLDVHLEAVLGAQASPVGLDLPGVALDVDPGIGPGQVLPEEGVAADQPGAGPLLEVDALGGDVGADPVAEDPVAVAAVGLAAAVPAPVAVGAADIHALAVLGLA